MTLDEIAVAACADPREIDFAAIPLADVDAAYARETDPAQRERLRVLGLRVEAATPGPKLPYGDLPTEQPRPEGMRCQLFGTTQCANCDAPVPAGCTLYCMECTVWYNCPCARGNYHARTHHRG